MPDRPLQLIPPLRQAGFSLLELTLVALILVIITAIALPGGDSSDGPRLESLARQFAEAIRHARSESLIRSRPVAIRLRQANRKIKVKWVDTSTSPWSYAGNLTHPVSKSDYIIETDRTLPGVSIEHQLTTRDGRSCDSEKAIWFDRQGAAWCKNPNDVAVSEYIITLRRGQHSRRIILDGPSGRVSVE